MKHKTDLHAHRHIGFYGGVRCLDMKHLAKEHFPDDPKTQTEWVHIICQVFEY